ncbi:MAG: STAS domain-containing protein [Thermodesulfobacteriota bacterium]
MIEITKNEDHILVKPGRDLVASMVSGFSEQIKTLMAESPKMIVIDLTGVRIVDSLGMGVLISTHNHLTKAGSSLKVINTPPDIYEAFVIMRLDHHFTIEPLSCPD